MLPAAIESAENLKIRHQQGLNGNRYYIPLKTFGASRFGGFLLVLAVLHGSAGERTEPICIFG